MKKGDANIVFFARYFLLYKNCMQREKKYYGNTFVVRLISERNDI